MPDTAHTPPAVASTNLASAESDVAPLPIAVAIVCRDNEETIGRTLASVRSLTQEIVAVDSGSRDSTIDLLREHGVRVLEREWMGHVKTKQVALDACSVPWALCLDSDESVEPALAQSIRAAFASEIAADVAGFSVNRKVFWRGRFLNHAWQPEWRLRLVRRAAVRWGGFDPHDAMEVIAGQPAQKIVRLAGDLRHDSIRTMPDFLANQAKHARIAARSLAAKGKRGSAAALVLSPVGAWVKQVVFRQAWRDGWRGWCAASATASATLMKHAALLELTRIDAMVDKNSENEKKDDAA